MEKLVDQMMTQMITTYRAQMPNVSAEFWDKFAQKVKASDLIDQLLPLYDKYYSLEDLRAVNVFYSSQAGQHMLSAMPKLMQESMAIGQAWGQKIGRQAAEEAQASASKQ